MFNSFMNMHVHGCAIPKEFPSVAMLIDMREIWRWWGGGGGGGGGGWGGGWEEGGVTCRDIEKGRARDRYGRKCFI